MDKSTILLKQYLTNKLRNFEMNQANIQTELSIEIAHYVEHVEFRQVFCVWDPKHKIPMAESQ